MKIIKKLGRACILPLVFLPALLTTGCDESLVDDAVGDILSVNPVPLAENWRMFFYHVHTIYSDDNPEYWMIKPSIAETIARASKIAIASNTDAAITINDHRTVDGLFDPGFAPFGAAVPIMGEEWGGNGHAGPIGFSGNTPITDGDGPEYYEAMVTETHDRGGIVVVHHSETWRSDRAHDVDGIEVLNGPIWTDGNYFSLDWWQRLLVAGEQITAVGGSDSHFKVLPIQVPINMVYAPSNSQLDMLDAVESGRVMVLQSPASSRAILTADVNNDGVYDDVMMGDKIAVTQWLQTVAFEVRIEGVETNLTLKLIDRNGVFYEEPIETGPEWNGSTYRFERTFTSLKKNFVRAELVAPLIGPVCVTNPIYAVGTLAPTHTEAELQGTVTFEGVAIQDAQIEVTPGRDSRATSSADGSYGLILPLGTYTVTVTLPDSSTQVIENVVLEDEDEVLDIVL